LIYPRRGYFPSRNKTVLFYPFLKISNCSAIPSLPSPFSISPKKKWLSAMCWEEQG